MSVTPVATSDLPDALNPVVTRTPVAQAGAVAVCIVPERLFVPATFDAEDTMNSGVPNDAPIILTFDPGVAVYCVVSTNDVPCALARIVAGTPVMVAMSAERVRAEP